MSAVSKSYKMFFQNVTHSIPTSTMIGIGAPVLLPPSLCEASCGCGGGLGRGFSAHLNIHAWQFW